MSATHEMIETLTSEGYEISIKQITTDAVTLQYEVCIVTPSEGCVSIGRGSFQEALDDAYQQTPERSGIKF